MLDSDGSTNMPLPSTSKLITLNSLPDDAIYSILKQIKSSNEVQRLKGVSKRFRRIIHHRGYGLARPKIDSMIVSFDFPQIPSQQIGKLRLSSSAATTPTVTFNINLVKSNRATPFKQASHSTEDMECPKKLSPTMFGSLQTTLKKFSINSVLEFNRIFIDKIFVKHFLRPFCDIKNVEILKFNYCTFGDGITVECMIELFKKTKCKNLEIIYCNGAEEIINDTLLTSINALESLRIQTNSCSTKFNITNKTLLHWMSSSSSSTATSTLPSTIDLINCQTCLTSLNLSTFLNFAYSNLKQQSAAAKKVSYDFGYIQAHPSDIKQFFILNNGFERNYSNLLNPNNNDSPKIIQFKSTLINRFDGTGFETPEMAFFMSFLKSKSNLRNSKFECNFILNCEALQTIEPKIILEKQQILYKFSNLENKFKIISY